MREAVVRLPTKPSIKPDRATFVMASVLLVLGFFLIYPVFLLLIQSFNIAGDIISGGFEWGLANWGAAFDDPRILRSIGNTFQVWILTTGISFPTAVLIAWTLARTRVPFSYSLEFMFWVAYMFPGIATTVAWIMLLDPDVGILNAMIERLPFVDRSPLNIFSVPGIVWAHLMANGIAIKVMLLTPAFRNMDYALEEAARVAGASKLFTTMRITLPLMVSPMALVLALQMLRIFQTFEIERLLGVSFNFHVYSTLIFELVRGTEVPEFGKATALASITLMLVALIVPMQRWIIQRRRYTTITSGFRPGLLDLGKGNWVAFGLISLLLLALTVAPAMVLMLGSFMSRAGFFEATPVFTLRHWSAVLGDNLFLTAFRTTLTIAIASAAFSPLLFSLLAYILVRTQWRGRGLLDLIIWGSGAIPGMLSGLGFLVLFIGTPGLGLLYGTVGALILVVVLQGNTTGTNVFKGVFVQVGADMEEAARVAGAGWVRTYFRIWLPAIAPTLVLVATLNFVTAANTTSSIILLASRDVLTMSILALELASPGIGAREQAGIVSLILMLLTVGVALIARWFGLRLGVRHQ